MSHDHDSDIQLPFASLEAEHQNLIGDTAKAYSCQSNLLNPVLFFSKIQMASTPAPPKGIETVQLDAAAMMKQIFPDTSFDCYFVIDGQRIGAHQTLLSGLSPVFAALESRIVDRMD